MSRHWWYLVGPQKMGPVVVEDMKRLLADGSVTPSTLVWREGFAEWVSASTTTELWPVPPPVPIAEIPAAAPTRPSSPSANRVPLAAKDLPAGRWRRFIARSIDLNLLSIAAGYAVFSFAFATQSRAFMQWISRPGSELLFGLCVIPIALLFEALIFGLFGTTPGKAVSGVRVLRLDGQQPSLGDYLKRQVGVYVYGLGFCIPLVSFVTAIVQSRRLASSGATHYDEGAFQVQAPRLTFPRALGITSVVVGVLCICGVLSAVGQSSVAPTLARTEPRPLTDAGASPPPVGFQPYEGPVDPVPAPSTTARLDESYRSSLLEEKYSKRAWSGNALDQFEDTTTIERLAARDKRLPDLPAARAAVSEWQRAFMKLELKPPNVALYAGVDMVILMLEQTGTVCSPAKLDEPQPEGRWWVSCVNPFSS